MSATLADRFRLALSRWLISPLQGLVLSDWLALLAANRFAVAPRYWPRALLTTASAAVNSVQARRERARFGAAIDATAAEPPLFILGHYRSGTTHLHNLFGRDRRFAFVNNYQASFPRTFLLTEGVSARLGAALTMRKRPHDDVALDLQVPTEDELALCADTLLSPHLAWAFPRRADAYELRYLTFADATGTERARWIASLRDLVRKLTYLRRRPLVLKSPLHTARIPLLLEAFPEARFVHLHRDPFRVYQSTRHMELRVEPLFRYQRSRPSRLDARILRRYRVMYRAYLRDREQIPAGRLVEIGYDELDRDPLAALERIYRGLGLPSFAETRPDIHAYVDSLRGYRKNRYSPLDPELGERILQEWGITFDAFGYDRHYRSLGDSP